MNTLLRHWQGPHHRLFLGAVALIALILGVVWFTHTPATAAGPPPAPAAVAVEIATVTRATVPLYMEGLGNVQAFYTANITARVDGELQSVAFTEGQMVKKGQLLAQIDPRPNQAALDQAIATEARDNAQLNSAKRDAGPLRETRTGESCQPGDARHAARHIRADAGAGQDGPGDHRQCPHAARLHHASSHRSQAAPASAWSIPGNNVHASDTTAIVVVTQVQPIAIVFTCPRMSC